MPDDVPVFLIDLGAVDALLPASDFDGLASQSDFRAVPAAGEGEVHIDVKGRRYSPVIFEPFLARLFSPAIPERDMDAIAFLRGSGSGIPRAFVLYRPFEMRTFPVRDFRLLPAGIRAALRTRGVLALRFESEGRIQFLVDLGAFVPEKAGVAG